MTVTLKNELLTVTIEDKGAQLCSVKNAAGQEYIWQADPAIWGRHAPLLFPILGRLQDNAYTVYGETYHIPTHGFGRDSLFAVEQVSDTKVVFTLTDSEETLQVYPFPFLLKVIYELEDEVLKKTCRAENTGDRTMYFEVGGHDGFVAPHAPDQTMADCAILIPGMEEGIRPYGMNEACMLTPKDKLIPLPGGRIPLKPMTYALDTFVLDVPQPRKAILVDRDSKPLVTLEFPDYPYLGIWTADKGETNYVCIEPWTTLPDATFVGRDLTEKAGICSLEAGKSRDVVYTTTFHV